MNDTDKKKLESAIAIVDSLEGQVSNIEKRGPNAVKILAAGLVHQKDAAVLAKMKNQVLVPLAKLLKDAKTVRKDLETLYKEGSEAKKLAAYADGKAFRTKAQAKYLASTKDFEVAGLGLVNNLKTVLGADGTMYPGMSEVDVKVTIDSIGTFSKYYNALRIEMAKL